MTGQDNGRTGTMCMCSNHSDLLFRVRQVYHKTCTYSNNRTKNLKTLILTGPLPDDGIPFPYKFKYNAAGILDVAEPICIARENALSVIANYANSLELRKESCNDKVKIEEILMFLITNQHPATSVSPDVTVAYNRYYEYNNSEMQVYMKHRWGNATLKVRYQNPVTNEFSTADYPMVSLPPFFQILFCSAEMSDNHYKNEVTSVQPVLRLNATTQQFEVERSIRDSLLMHINLTSTGINNPTTPIHLHGDSYIDPKVMFSRHYNVKVAQRNIPFCN